MRVVYRDPNEADPPVFRWLTAHLPKSMKTLRTGDGYGVDYFVVQTDLNSVVLARITPAFHFFGWVRRLFAPLPRERVILNHPEYYSTFEDVLRAYEAFSHTEVVLEVWSES